MPWYKKCNNSINCHPPFIVFLPVKYYYYYNDYCITVDKRGQNHAKSWYFMRCILLRINQLNERGYMLYVWWWWCIKYLEKNHLNILLLCSLLTFWTKYIHKHTHTHIYIRNTIVVVKAFFFWKCNQMNIYYTKTHT